MFIDYKHLDFSEIKNRGGIGVLRSNLAKMQKFNAPYIGELTHDIDIYENLSEIHKFEILIIPNGVDEIWLFRHKNEFEKYLNDGKILINFSTNQTRFLPFDGYIASMTPIRIREIKLLNHPIFKGVKEYDLNYRRGVKGFFNRGYINAPQDALWIMKDSDGKCVGYIDKTTTKSLVLNTAGADLLWFGWFELSTAKRTGLNLLLWIENYLKTGDIGSDKNEPNYVEQSFIEPDLTPDYSGVKKLFITGGSSYHNGFFKNYNAKYKSFFDEIVYVGDLQNVNLNEFDLVVIASRISTRFLAQNKVKINEYANNGGNLIFFGEDQGVVFDKVKFVPGEVNFWWWLNKQNGANMPLLASNQNARFWRFLKIKEAQWHYHGTFETNDNICNLICDELGRPILYRDGDFKGLVYISALDPEFHIGQGFMPTTEPFFDKFLGFVCEKVRARKNGESCGC